MQFTFWPLFAHVRVFIHDFSRVKAFNLLFRSYCTLLYTYIVYINFNLYISSPENCQTFNNRLVCRKILLLLAIMRASNGCDKYTWSFKRYLGGFSLTTSKTIHELLSALLFCGCFLFLHKLNRFVVFVLFVVRKLFHAHITESTVLVVRIS